MYQWAGLLVVSGCCCVGVSLILSSFLTPDDTLLQVSLTTRECTTTLPASILWISMLFVG